MTEAEWLEATDPKPMLEFCRRKVSDRKWRLVVVELARSESLGWLPDARRSVVLGERWADGVASDAEVSGFCEETGAKWICLAAQAIETIEGVIEDERMSDEYEGVSWMHAMPYLFRESIGNPFRPVAFSPSWRTSTAVALAAQMYESRDFSAMPILADALQDAGCDSAEVLDHCRGPGPHVRGCWVVDLVLGKE